MNGQANGMLRKVLLVLAIIYVISPIDILPMCPLDDIAVMALEIIAQKRLKEQSAT